MIYCDKVVLRIRVIFRVHSSLLTELYKTRAYLLKSQEERGLTLVSISGVKSLKNFTQGE